jgi:hypothetical protein
VSSSASGGAPHRPRTEHLFADSDRLSFDRRSTVVAGHLRDSGLVSRMAASVTRLTAGPRGGGGATRCSGDAATEGLPGRSLRPWSLVVGSLGRLRAAGQRSAGRRPRAPPAMGSLANTCSPDVSLSFDRRSTPGAWDGGRATGRSDRCLMAEVGVGVTAAVGEARLVDPERSDGAGQSLQRATLRRSGRSAAWNRSPAWGYWPA